MLESKWRVGVNAQEMLLWKLELESDYIYIYAKTGRGGEAGGAWGGKKLSDIGRKLISTQSWKEERQEKWLGHAFALGC